MSTALQTALPTGTWGTDKTHSTANFAIKYMVSTFRSEFTDVDVQLDTTGDERLPNTLHWHSSGRLRSPSSAASRSASTKPANAVSVKRWARTKPTRSFGGAGTFGEGMAFTLNTMSQK